MSQRMKFQLVENTYWILKSDIMRFRAKLKLMRMRNEKLQNENARLKKRILELNSFERFDIMEFDEGKKELCQS